MNSLYSSDVYFEVERDCQDDGCLKTQKETWEKKEHIITNARFNKNVTDTRCHLFKDIKGFFLNIQIILKCTGS